MHIVTMVGDGRGHVRIAATRAPDLFRRQVAAETGEAHLIWCGIAPECLGPHAFVERLQAAVSSTRIGQSSYSLSAADAVRAVERLYRSVKLTLRLRAVGKPWFRMIGRLKRGCQAVSRIPIFATSRP